MAVFARTGFVAIAFSLAVGIGSGCSSSQTAAIGGALSDASQDGSTSHAGATSAGGGSSVGGGSGAGGGGGLAGGTSGNGGSTTGSGGGTSRTDGGPVIACTKDSDCTASSPRCDLTAKQCVQCLFDNECPETARCTAGACKPLMKCTNSRDCRNNTDGRTICSAASGLCVACATNADCGNNQICAVDTCVDSATCTVGADSGSGCAVGQVCSPGGKCVACVTDKDCAGGTKCIASACRTPCASDNDCVSGNQLCDTKLGACVDCTADKDCTVLQYCATGVCKPDVCAQGVKSCVGNAVVQCTANGSGILPPVSCATDEKCVAANGSASCIVPKLPDGGTPPPATCFDKTKNGNETDVDCGGSCTPCADGKLCAVAADCTSDVCQASCSGLLCLPGTRNKVCRSAACNDTVKNGKETDVDCGGGSCKRCPVGDSCTVNSDCEADICKNGTCVAAPCTASQCTPCLLPTDQACCLPSGLCGCAAVFPFPGSCQ